MIKHFNTALSAGTSAAGSSKKGGGMGTIVLIGILAVAAYFGYKYIVKRNQPIVTSDED
jgi:hypothetical protein